MPPSSLGFQTVPFVPAVLGCVDVYFAAIVVLNTFRLDLQLLLIRRLVVFWKVGLPAKGISYHIVFILLSRIRGSYCSI